MAREIGYWRLVQARTRVDVDGVGNVFGRLRIVDSRMEGFVLTGRCEQQAAVGRERQSSEERSQGLVEVDGCVPDPKAADAVHAWGVRHDSRQGHRRRWRGGPAHGWR